MPTLSNAPVEPRPRLHRRVLRTLRSVVLTLLLVAVVSHIFGVLRAPDLPDVAPAFALRDTEGEMVTLEELRGKTVVLNFWATWCTPCRIEIPSFSRFANSHPDVVVLGIAHDGDQESLASAREDLDISYRVLVGTKPVFEAYGVSTFPTTVIVDPEGRVRSAYTGIMLDHQLLWATR